MQIKFSNAHTKSNMLKPSQSIKESIQVYYYQATFELKWNLRNQMQQYYPLWKKNSV